jgi:glutathione S-transferase
MADRSLKLLSKNRLERLEYRWLCSFVMSQFLDEALSAGVFEIASRQQGQLPRGLEADSDFLDNDLHFLDNRCGDLCFAIQ